jgi:NAD(P)H-dependent FMN reductase
MVALRCFRMPKVSVPRGPNRFTERELARVVRAAHRAGGVERIEVDLDGRIILVPKQDKAAEETPEDVQRLL